METVEGLSRDSLLYLYQLEKETTVTAATYTVRTADDVVLCDTTSNAITITLPLAINGRRLTVLRIAGGNNVTVAAAGSNTVNGAASVVVSSSYSPLRLKANAARTGWYSA